LFAFTDNVEILIDESTLPAGGRMLSGSPADLTNEQRRANNAAKIRQPRNNLLREQIALWLLVGEPLLIVILLYLAQAKSPPCNQVYECTPTLCTIYQSFMLLRLSE
jgi:hypothetical protein